MIELGDVFNVSARNTIALATESTLDHVRLTTYSGKVYNSREGCDTFKHDEVRDMIRSDYYRKIGNVDEDVSGVMFAGKEYRMDVDRTEKVYSYKEGEMNLTPLLGDIAFRDTHNNEMVFIESVGWEDSSLSDDLIRLQSGGVEPVSTVVQAMKEGVWILMTPPQGP